MGDPTQAGNPSTRGGVPHLGGVDFFHVNALPRGAGVRFIRAFVKFSAPTNKRENKMSSRYRPGELFRQNLLNNSEYAQNSEEIDDVSDFEASFPDQAEVSIESTPNTKGKRKASADGIQSNSKAKAAKKTAQGQRKPKIMAWIPERVELLLKYLKEYKATAEFSGKDFEQDLAAMYSEIRRCLSVDYPEEFGPQSTTEPNMPLKDMNSEEYQAYKQNLDREKELIKKGYDRVKEKIRNVRQDFRAAVNKGTRSGSGKIVQENFLLLTEIWGGSPATTSLPFGVDGTVAEGGFQSLYGEESQLDSTDESMY